MLRRHIFDLVLCNGILCLTPDGSAGGGGTDNRTPEERLTAAQSELATAQNTIASITKERDDARTQATNLQAQFDTLSTTANDLRTQVTNLTTQVGSLNTELSSTKSQLTAAQGNVTRLETLCGVKGIDPNAAIPPASQPGSTSEADFEARLKSAKTPLERQGILAEYEKAVKEGKL